MVEDSKGMGTGAEVEVGSAGAGKLQAGRAGGGELPDVSQALRAGGIGEGAEEGA